MTSVCSHMVTVVVPVYNSEHSLRRCLNSIFEQTYKNYEVMVVDDGSTDGSTEILKNYVDKVLYIRQDNSGPSAARNAGMSVATGDFITFLDADDYWRSDFLCKCIEFLDKNPEEVAVNVATEAIRWDGSAHFVPRYLEGQMNDCVIDENCQKGFYEFWAQHDHVRTGSVVIRRSVIKCLGGFRTEFSVAEDLEYWGLVATCGPWGFIPQPLFVTDGTETAAMHGWLAKLRKRGRNCPSVETWEERITPRLKDSEKASFRIVRGRIALNFAYIKLLAGLRDDARHVVLKYGSDFPENAMARLLRRCAPSAPLWYGCCCSLFLREVWKDICLKKRFGGVS